MEQKQKPKCVTMSSRIFYTYLQSEKSSFCNSSVQQRSKGEAIG
jgi:hypothetical protein